MDKGREEKMNHYLQDIFTKKFILCILLSFFAGIFLSFSIRTFYPHFFKKVVPIVFCVDDKYAPFVPVSIQSIIAHKNKSNLYRVYVLGKDTSTEHKRVIESMTKENVKVQVIDLEPYLNKTEEIGNLALSYWFTEAIYYRFFIPEVLQAYDKAVYMEPDMILMSDIALIYHKDLEGKMMAVSPQIPYEANRSPEWLAYCHEKLKMKQPENYFNSGLLLMNLKKMRENAFRETAIQAMKNHQFDYLDQDTLNYLYSDDILLLDPMYNAEVTLLRQMDKPFIVHFSSYTKPWKETLPIRTNILYSNQYWVYARQVPNYGEILEIAIKNYMQKSEN